MVRAAGQHPDHSVSRPNHVLDRCSHVEMEGRVLARLLGQHGEDGRLGDEAAYEAKRLGADSGPPPASLVEVDGVDDSLRELAEPVPKPPLVEGVNATGLQPIAAESALEVGVPL